MSESQDSEADFDLAAAGLRADGGDLRISLEVLAAKLQGALPDSTEVQRTGRGLLRRGPSHVTELRVRLGEMRYQLSAAGQRLECRREREVGGISIKREALDPEAWVSALAADLQDEAQRSAGAREALARLLG